MNSDTLHIIVSCCLEETRTRTLEKVVDSLLSAKDFPLGDTLVFDNASTHDGAAALLDKFPIVCRGSENYGLWSAVNWCLLSHESALGNGKKYNNVYVIESDCVHYAYDRIKTAREALSVSRDIASVRTQEFYVAEKHLYDKGSPSELSRRYAWTRLSNHFTGQQAYFKHTDVTNVYVTNLAPQLPALNRMSFMLEAFAELEKKGKVTEADFQEVYFKKWKETALVDGGMYSTKESYESALTSSYTDAAKLAAIGYRTTRSDEICPAARMSVEISRK